MKKIPAINITTNTNNIIQSKVFFANSTNFFLFNFHYSIWHIIWPQGDDCYLLAYGLFRVNCFFHFRDNYDGRLIFAGIEPALELISKKSIF